MKLAKEHDRIVVWDSTGDSMDEISVNTCIERSPPRFFAHIAENLDQVVNLRKTNRFSSYDVAGLPNCNTTVKVSRFLHLWQLRKSIVTNVKRKRRSRYSFSIRAPTRHND